MPVTKSACTKTDGLGLEIFLPFLMWGLILVPLAMLGHSKCKAEKNLLNSFFFFFFSPQGTSLLSFPPRRLSEEKKVNWRLKHQKHNFSFLLLF